MAPVAIFSWASVAKQGMANQQLHDQTFVSPARCLSEETSAKERIDRSLGREEAREEARRLWVRCISDFVLVHLRPRAHGRRQLHCPAIGNGRDLIRLQVS
jgi:hypothetical protein